MPAEQRDHALVEAEVRMAKIELLATDIADSVGLPEVYRNNTQGHSHWLFAMRQRLYCKAKQEPEYQFYTLYGMVFRKDVLAAAWKAVRKNKGAPGADGVSIEDIDASPEATESFLSGIEESLKNKTYEPDKVRRVYIPKANGKMRPLGIPTVRDRVVQMAVLLLIEPIFEADFKECSYGFRPGRNAHQALEAIQTNARQGRVEVYDADLASYFDTIPHDKLLACVQKRIGDGSIIRLIRKWLRAIVVEEPQDGGPKRYFRPKEGTPQGGVISPLLANLYLHWFDVMFHKEYGPRKWADARLIRYADDFVVMAKRIGPRVRGFIEYVLEERMGLKLNREKTGIRKLSTWGNNLEFLGYVLRTERAKQWNGRYFNLLASPKSLKRMRAAIRQKTNSSWCFRPCREVIKELNVMTQGWGNYFSLGFCQPSYKAVDSYVYRRLILFLKRRSQRGYRRPKGMSWYQHITNLGYNRLAAGLRPVCACSEL